MILLYSCNIHTRTYTCICIYILSITKYMVVILKALGFARAYLRFWLASSFPTSSRQLVLLFILLFFIIIMYSLILYFIFFLRLYISCLLYSIHLFSFYLWFIPLSFPFTFLLCLWLQRCLHYYYSYLYFFLYNIYPCR